MSYVVTIDPNNETCFGNFIGQYLLRYILGYNVLIYSSLKNIMLGDSGKSVSMCVYVCACVCVCSVCAVYVCA